MFGKEGLVSYFPGKMILVPYFIGASSNEMHCYSMVEVRYTPRNVSTRFIKPHAFGPQFDKSSRDLYLGV